MRVTTNRKKLLTVTLEAFSVTVAGREDTEEVRLIVACQAMVGGRMHSGPAFAGPLASGQKEYLTLAPMLSRSRVALFCPAP